MRLTVPIGTDQILFRRDPLRNPTDRNPTITKSDPIGCSWKTSDSDVIRHRIRSFPDRICSSDWISWELVTTKGGLMSFNSFLSTSIDRDISLAYADSNQYTPDCIGVFFQITIVSSISSTPFANVRNISHFQAEEKNLFSMHSVFRIGEIKQIEGNNRLWQAELTLTGDNDPQLHALTEQIREETFPHLNGWHRLAQLLITLAQFDKAQQVCEIMLAQTTCEYKQSSIYHMLGMVKQNQGEYTQAITFYEKASEIGQKLLAGNHPGLATSYINIGSVHDKMGEYSKALSYYEKALKIDHETLPVDHPNLGTSYHNIGSVYCKMGEYSKALSSHEKALEIKQKTLLENHPGLATSYNNIGLVYDSMADYSKALSYYEKALGIGQKSLPTNHPDLAASYNNIGTMYDNMGEYSKALSSYEKSREILAKTLPENHPSLGTSYQ